MFSIDVDIKPDPKVCAALMAKLERSLRNFREPLTSTVDRVVIPSIAGNFTASGPGWEPLDDDTTKKRQRAGLDTERPLIATGRGMRAATVRARWRITSGVAEYHGDSFPASTHPMVFHHFGTRDGHFPARPWATVDTDDELQANRIFSRWTQTTIRTNLAAWR